MNEPAEDAERCETCRFVLRVDEDKHVCRRFPPRPNPVGVSVESYSDGETRGSVSSDVEQPEVMPEDWCGEWQAKRA